VSHEWGVDQQKTTDNWLELKGKILGADTWRSAQVRSDGCIHFNSYANLPLELSPDRKDPACCDDYLHICDIDELIEDLKEIKRLALAHYKEWPR
jgi:hypothetical protein